MNNRISSRPPARPNITHPSNLRSSVQGFSQSRRSTTSSKISKFEQYLYPQNFSSAAPLATNVLYPIEASFEEEEDLEPTSIYDKFDRQRKKVLSKYIKPADPVVIVVSLKSDRLKITKPMYIKNDSYQRSNSPRIDETYSAREDEIQDDPEFVDAFFDKLVEFDLNETWFDSILLDLDELYPDFLNQLQTEPQNKGKLSPSSQSKNVNSKIQNENDRYSPKKTDDDAALMMEDPIQSAYTAALQKQRNNATYDEEEITQSQQFDHRTLTAAEINKQWGFKDPEIGKYIAKFRRQLEADAKKK